VKKLAGALFHSRAVLLIISNLYFSAHN
jgi:hypothetical protein